MGLVKITLFLDAETLKVFERLASEAEVPLGEFIADMLAAHIEICSVFERKRPAIDLSLN